MPAEKNLSRREFVIRSGKIVLAAAGGAAVAELVDMFGQPLANTNIQKSPEERKAANPNPTLYPSPYENPNTQTLVPIPETIPNLKTSYPSASPRPTSEIIGINASEIVWRGDPVKPYIYLTIDDCYDPNMVIKAMDTADKYGVKLTFFPIGTNVERFPQVFKEAYLRGHAVENHTYNHEWLDQKTASDIEYQIVKQHEAVQNAIGKDYKQTFLRPPGGAGVFMTEHPWPLLWETAQRLGYKIAMWTADSNGWRMYPRTDAAAIDYIMGNVDADFFKGSIILQHALPDDMIALPLIVEKAKKNNWKMITMPQGIR